MSKEAGHRKGDESDGYGFVVGEKDIEDSDHGKKNCDAQKRLSRAL